MPKISKSDKSEKSEKISKSDLKRVARGAREARLANLAPLEGAFADDPKLNENRRAAEKLFKPMIAASKTDAAKFDKLRARNEADGRRILEKRRAQAVKRAGAMKKTLLADLADHRTALDQLTINPNPDAAPLYVSLAKPFLIWAQPSNMLIDSRIEAGNSWAKIKRRSTSDTSYRLDDVTFYYMWDNPSDYYAVIDVETFLVLSGHCVISVGGGFWPGNRSTSLGLSATLNLFRWWENPPTQPYWQETQTRQVTSMYLSDGGFMALGKFDSRDVAGSYGVQHKLFLVPPHGVAIFEASLNISYSHYSGTIDVDFATGDFAVRSPYLVVSVLTAPPAMASLETIGRAPSLGMPPRELIMPQPGAA